MPIYLYTLRKYLKSSSTWVITIITLIIIFLLSGYVAFSNFDAPKKTPENYGRLAISLVAGLTAFLSIFTSVFAGFKSATMFKDEVEDGTFLVLLSKPIRRSSIIFFKWLALQSIIAIYTFLVAGSFALSLVIFDNGSQVPGLGTVYGLKTLASQAHVVGAFMWMIFLVSSLIFSSIALLLSTKLTVGSTIGISIALGVIIPVTSLVGLFTKKPEYYNVTNNWISGSSLINGDEQAKLIANQVPDYQDDPYYIYNLSAKTNEVDSYRKIWFFDLNFQFTELANFASESVVPSKIMDVIDDGSFQAPGLGDTYKLPTSSSPYSQNIEENIAQFNYAIANTWLKTAELRATAYMAFAAVYTPILPTLPNTVISDDTVEKFKDIGITINDNIITGDQVMAFVAELNTIDADGTDIVRVKNILTALYSIIYDLRSTENKTITSEMKGQLEILRLISLPINMTTNRFMTTYNVKDSDAEAPSRTASAPNRTTINNSVALGIIAQGDEQVGYQTYSDTISIIKSGHTLVRSTTEKYASKNSILYAYLIIAFALIPISYFAIRRQDFR